MPRVLLLMDAGDPGMKRAREQVEAAGVPLAYVHFFSQPPVLSLPGLPAVWSVSANAFLFALGALGLLQPMGRLRGGSPEMLILCGIALNFTAGAFLSLLQFVASADALQQLVFWTMGSVAGASWLSVTVLAVVLAVTAPFPLKAAWQLTALQLGKEQARSCGVDAVRLRRWSLLRVSLLAASAVSRVGVIEVVTPAMLAKVYGVEVRVERCSRGRLVVLIDDETV